MLKVNEFEYGITDEQDVYNYLHDEEANVHYRFSSAEDLVGDLKELEAMIEHHMRYQVPRLSILNDYYLGRNAYINNVQRRMNENKADHRISHNFAKYISQFIQGYLVGNPIKVSHENDNVTKELNKINLLNDANATNADLILDLSKFGRAYELIIRNDTDEDRFYLSDAFKTFVIYSETVDMKPIAAVRYITNKDKNGSITIEPTLYTKERVYKFNRTKADDIQLTLEGNGVEHAFNEVPIIEYQNNRFRQGDYENVITLIDAYDSAQSDTANYMTDLNDALLVVIGNVEAEGDDFERNLRELNAVFLQPGMDPQGKVGNASVEYKYKQYDVQGTEAYKNRVAEDIHKFSNTPNMNDESFAGNASGVAMKYKLFGLEQARAIKERLFSKGLRERYKLIANVKGAISEFDSDLDLNELEITFTPNFPEATEAELDAFTKAGGQLSQETLLTQLSFVESAKEELERVRQENPTAMDAMSDEEKAFWQGGDANGADDSTNSEQEL